MIRASMLTTCCLLGLVAAEPSVSSVKAGGRYMIVIDAPKSSLDKHTAALLSARITLNEEETPLHEVAERLAKATGATIVIDPELRVTQPPVTLNVEDMTASVALAWMCQLTGTKAVPMHGGLYLTQRETQQRNVRRMYDVTSLVVGVKDFPGPKMGIRSFDEGGFEIIDGFEHESDDEDRLELIEEMVARHIEGR